jgi:hypothetical protein
MTVAFVFLRGPLARPSNHRCLRFSSRRRSRALFPLARQAPRPPPKFPALFPSSRARFPSHPASSPWLVCWRPQERRDRRPLRSAREFPRPPSPPVRKNDETSAACDLLASVAAIPSLRPEGVAPPAVRAPHLPTLNM